MIDGYLMLGRSFFETELWRESRPYSRAEAWLDLIQSAAYAPVRRLVAGHFIEVPRGGIVASVRFLSDRWKWSNTKVCLFLDALENESMIRREKRHQNTVILLCNFNKYNTQKRRRDDGGTTARRHRDDEIEEGKEQKLPPSREAGAGGGEEVPDVAQALAQIAHAKIPEDFARMVYADWHSREGRDAGGVLVRWPGYVAKRWAREGAEWRTGTHKAQRNGSNHKPAARSAANARNTNAAAADEY